MNQAISRKTLCGYLFLLRQALTDGRNYPPSHVVFFDSRSFYFHFAPCPCGKTTVEGVLQKMEPCIPLAITDESLALFLTACKEAESDEKADSFLQSSKADFLMLLRYAAGDEGKWQAVTALCESLRLQNEA